MRILDTRSFHCFNARQRYYIVIEAQFDLQGTLACLMSRMSEVQDDLEGLQHLLPREVNHKPQDRA